MTPETAARSPLTEALAKVQAKLPEVRKGETATVPTKTGGSYKYSYADLAEVSKAILPILGEHGLTWITKPTLNAAGKFVLAYKLKHVSGEEETGEYPLSGGTAQEQGSAITYARRYCLCAVTGVAPESDDDDGAAASRRPQQDAWEQAEKPPSVEQVQVFADLSKRIGEATTPDEITALGGQVKHAQVEGYLTGGQYRALSNKAAQRIAELQQEVPS